MAPVLVSLSRSELDVVRHGATTVVTAPAIFRIEGPGALQVLQGLFTNDLEKPGDRSIVYGAVLSPKGMILFDAWVARAGQEFWLVAHRDARAAADELFRKSVPPRLARVTDLTDGTRAAWLVGAQGFQVLARAGLGPLPDAAGRITLIDTVRGRLVVGLGSDGAPFGALALGPDAALEVALETLRGAGSHEGDARHLEAARILAGWPALGAEISERTLPQEVRYDELGGVSYTKGCYVGQETVARLHFRGHTNRELRGLRWDHPDPPDEDTILHGEREVGTIRSLLALDDRTLGLAPIRREVGVGETVSAGGRLATVVPLPFSAGDLDG